MLEARAAGDALLMCEQHRGHIDLVLTDVVMPLMGGEQLAQRLIKERPDLRILYMSGYPDWSSRPIKQPARAPFLEKPFTPEKLLRRVREVLAEPPAPPADGGPA